MKNNKQHVLKVQQSTEARVEKQGLTEQYHQRIQEYIQLEAICPETSAAWQGCWEALNISRGQICLLALNLCYTYSLFDLLKWPSNSLFLEALHTIFPLERIHIFFGWIYLKLLLYFCQVLEATLKNITLAKRQQYTFWDYDGGTCSSHRGGKEQVSRASSLPDPLPCSQPRILRNFQVGNIVQLRYSTTTSILPRSPSSCQTRWPRSELWE